jgi:Fic-DOC domain mobile mystery protein B
MSDFDDVDKASTPLSFEQMQGLIPTQIASRSDLNAAEQRNILKATQKTRRSLNQKGISDILTDTFICKLHKDMLGEVWKWAGKYRKHDTNLGVSFLKIPMELRLLLGDTQYWLEHQVYPSHDEAILRFHHRLVLIHPFPNGNGRHARLMADLLIEKLGDRRFTWGQVNLIKPGEARLAYIQALQAADRKDVQPLLKFARS